jgi:hypothetical protein
MRRRTARRPHPPAQGAAAIQRLRLDDGAVLRSTLPWPVAAEVQDRLAQLDRQQAEAPFRRAADGAAAAGFAARPLGIRGVDASDEKEHEPGCACSGPRRAKRRRASSSRTERPQTWALEVPRVEA